LLTIVRVYKLYLLTYYLHDVIKVCSVEYVTTEIEIESTTFKSWTVHRIIEYFIQLSFLTHPVHPAPHTMQAASVAQLWPQTLTLSVTRGRCPRGDKCPVTASRRRYQWIVTTASLPPCLRMPRESFIKLSSSTNVDRMNSEPPRSL